MAIHDQHYEQSDWRHHVAVNLTDYTSDELNLFAGVLDAALNESISKGRCMPFDVMSRRLFDAARRGERDPSKLRAAIFREAVAAS